MKTSSKPSTECPLEAETVEAVEAIAVVVEASSRPFAACVNWAVEIVVVVGVEAKSEDR